MDIIQLIKKLSARNREDFADAEAAKVPILPMQINWHTSSKCAAISEVNQMALSCQLINLRNYSAFNPNNLAIKSS